MTDLRLGTDKIKVRTADISSVELNYALNDIKNYGKRNASFSTNITVYITEESDKVFKGIHNINTVGGYQVGKKVYGEILENGIPILIGNFQVTEVYADKIEGILSSNNISLFEDLGSKLITGNANSSDDVVFTGELFTHTYDISTVRNYLKKDPSNHGTGIEYGIVDYDNTISEPSDIQLNYPLSPAIYVKQLFDKIITDAGYTYTLSDDISTLMNKMVILYNGVLNNGVGVVGDSSYGYYFLGDPSGDYSHFYANGSNIPLNSSTWNYNNETSKPVPYGTIRGYCLSFPGITHIPQTAQVQGGYDNLMQCPSTYHQTSAAIRLPLPGTYQIDVSLRMYNWSTTLADMITLTAQLYSPNVPNGAGSFDIVKDLDCAPITNQWVGVSEEVTITEPTDMFIYMFSNRYPYSQIGNANVKLTFGSESNVKLTLKKYKYSIAPTVTINNLRPLNYKKSELIYDIVAMFNAIILVDPNDEHKLSFISYPSYFQGGTTIDWSNKIDSDSVSFTPIKNEFPDTIFTSVDDTDLYTTDFLTKWPWPIGSLTVNNDSEFIDEKNEIKLYSSTTAMKNIGSGYEVPVIADVKGGWKTTWKPRILLTNSVDYSGIYGIDASFNNGVITKWNTFSHKDTSSYDINTSSIYWDTLHSYSTTKETNRGLYNKFYKADIESNLDENAFMLKAKVQLNSNDLKDLDFRNYIYIKDKIGGAYYKINKIKKYKPNQIDKLTEVELIKVNFSNTNYDISVNTLQSFITYIAETGGSSTTSSSGTGGTGSATALSALTDVNLTSPADGEVLSYDAAQSKWVNGQANATFESLTDVSIINKADEDGVLWDTTRNKWRNVPTVDISALFVKRAGDTMTGGLSILAGGINIVNDSSIGGNERITGNEYIGGTLRVNSDVSIGSTLRVKNDITFDADIVTPVFVSGWAGSGAKMDLNGTDYDLTVDNLTVRKGMRVYELNINKISAIGGGFIVSVANGKAYNVSGSNIYFDEDGTSNQIQFQAGDYIRAQQWTGRNINYYLGRVNSVTHSSTLGSAYISVTNISGTCWTGAELVQVGSDTDANRRSLIYLTAADSNNPYIDILAEVNNGSFSGKTKARLGNLSGINDSNFTPSALSGYGLYSNNAYLTGSIVLPQAGMTNEGTADGSIRIWAGSSFANRATAPFRVTQNGALTATGIAELGTATADYSGKTSGIAIRNADIWENAYNGDDSVLWLNRLGYNGGNTRFRNTAIGDGKGNSIMVFNSTWCNMWVKTTFHEGMYVGGYEDITNGPWSLLTAYGVNFGGFDSSSRINGNLELYGGLNSSPAMATFRDSQITFNNKVECNALAKFDASIQHTGNYLELGGKHKVIASYNDDTCAAAVSDISGFSTSITPKGNKIYVSASLPVYTSSSSDVTDFYINVGGTNYLGQTMHIHYGTNIITFSTIVDVTPNSAVTVKLRWSGNTSATYYGSTGTYGIGQMSIIDLF